MFMQQKKRTAGETNSHGKRERLVFFDMIRIFACLCVVIVHFNATISNGFSLPNQLISNYYLHGKAYLGDIGVCLFFMLSGATQMLTAKERQLSDYYKKRFLNLFPLFWIAYIVVTVIDFLYNKGIALSHPCSVFYSVFGVDGYLCSRGMLGFEYYKIGEWFLGCILLIYAIFPVLYMGIKKAPVLTILVAVAIYVVFERVEEIGPYKVTKTTFFLRVPEILFGMLYVKYRLWEGKKAIYTEAVALCAFTLVWIFRESLSGLTVTIPFCACLFCLFVWISKVIKGERLKHSITAIAGITYPVFLIHHWLISKMVMGFDLAALSKGEIMMMFISYLLVTIIFSWLLKHYGERLITWVFQPVPEKRKRVLACIVFLGVVTLPIARTTMFIRAAAETDAFQTREGGNEDVNGEIEENGDRLKWLTLEIRESKGFHYLDTCNDAVIPDGVFSLAFADERYQLEGWAIDPDGKTTASAVFVQVADEYYQAEYGKERVTVADYFNEENYVYCGYTITLDAAKVNQAGYIQIHVVSGDGTYRFSPVVYSVESPVKYDKPLTDLPLAEFDGPVKYLSLDIFADVLAGENEVYLTPDKEQCYIEGWATDPLAGSVAGAVYIEVGQEVYRAEYGKPRPEVAEAYGGNLSYTNCGFTLTVGAQEIREAGRIVIEVVSADGEYRYKPVSYQVLLTN